jgi:hypothetical protein
VELFHERTTSQTFVACANSSNVDHEEREWMHPCYKYKQFFLVSVISFPTSRNRHR